MNQYLLVLLSFVHVLADSDFAKQDGAPPSKIGRAKVSEMNNKVVLQSEHSCCVCLQLLLEPESEEPLQLISSGNISGPK